MMKIAMMMLTETRPLPFQQVNDDYDYVDNYDDDDDNDDSNLKGSSADQLSLNHIGQEKHLQIVIETVMKMMMKD